VSTTTAAATATATTVTTTAKPKQAKTTATSKPVPPPPPPAKQTPTPPSTSPSTSTALLWLLSTTLSLITAPLVEPRYFILPWLFWRLLLPAWTPIGNNNPSTSSSSASASWTTNKLKTLRGVDPRLFLETAWFLAINLGTMYMFLFRPFYWRDGENGELLDGGKVQRFMW
jgi:alpha-1,2-glucosyltransferase